MLDPHVYAGHQLELLQTRKIPGNLLDLLRLGGCFIDVLLVPRMMC